MLRLVALGGLSLVDGGDRVVAQRRKLALLAILAGSGDRAFSRDKLVAYLWPDSPAESARHSLDQLVYSLRRQLGDAVFSGTDPLHLNHEVIESDVASFEAALARGADIEAVAAYSGPFLDGFFLSGGSEFERWVETVRVRLTKAYADALERVARHAEEIGEWRSAVDFRRQLVQVDPLNPHSVLGLLRSLAASGDRADALRVAAKYELLVRDELGAAPDLAFQVFAAELRASCEVGDDRHESVASASIVHGTRRRDETERAAPDDAVAPERSGGIRDRPPPGQGSPHRARAVLLVAVATVSVALAVALIVRAAVPRSGDVSDQDPRRVVVAVFENRTGNRELDIVGLMAADRIASALAQTGIAHVVARSFDGWDLMLAAPGASTVQTLARQTGAAIVVRGAYYLENDSLLYTADGIATTSDRIIFTTGGVKGSRADPGEAIEKLRQRVVAAVATQIDPSLERWEAAAGKQPITFEAYREFADGMAEFVSALASMNDGATGITVSRQYVRAREHLENAARMDTTSSIATLWAFWARDNVGDRAGADSLLRSVESRRASMTALERALFEYELAFLHGTPQEYYTQAVKLAELAPASEFLYCLGRDALEAGHPEETIRALAQLNGDYAWVRLLSPFVGLQMRAYVQLHDAPRALALATIARKQFPQDLSHVYAEIDALEALGRLNEVDQAVTRSLDRPPTAFANPGSIMLYAGLKVSAAGEEVQAGRLFAQALTWYDSERASELPPPARGFGRARSLYYLRRWEDARASFEALADPPGGSTAVGRNSLLYLGPLAARRRDTTEVSRIRTLLQSPLVRPAQSAYFEARVAAVFGNRDRALSQLRSAVALGAQAQEVIREGDAGPSMDPDFSQLRRHPLFRSAVGPW